VSFLLFLLLLDDGWMGFTVVFASSHMLWRTCTRADVSQSGRLPDCIDNSLDYFIDIDHARV
jgi:hypothetical protein